MVWSAQWQLPHALLLFLSPLVQYQRTETLQVPGLVNVYSLLLKIAIEIVSFPIKHGGSFHSYVSLPEGTHKTRHFILK